MEKYLSNCCTAPIYENTDICSRCKEHCEMIGEAMAADPTIKPVIGELEQRLNLTLGARPEQEYLDEQIAEAKAEQVQNLKELIDNREIWEEGAGSHTTLRCHRDSNEIAGSLYLFQSVTWES